jgi:hypothetical protein
MKVFNLQCDAGHAFEGWFASEDDYQSQHERGLVECPLCGQHHVTRMPAAPRLHLGTVREPTPATPESVTLESMWMQAVRHVLAHTEDVGERFAEEARRIHYGEIESRGIRGRTTPDERRALDDEGIDVFSLPMPQAAKGTAH